MVDKVQQTEETDDVAALLFLAVLVNRMGGKAFMSVDELTANWDQSAIEFNTQRDDDGEPVGIGLRTLSRDDALAIYKEHNV
jgi:hypothetical protein